MYKTILTTLFSCLLLACAEHEPEQASPEVERELVVAVNSPLKYFSQRLLGDQFEVVMMAPEDIDPAQWNPSIEDIGQLQKARLIILNGAGYSPWLDKVSLSPSSLLTSSNAEDWISMPAQVTHSHGPEGEHAHGDYAFTTWMDLDLAAGQASQIAAGLGQQFPEQTDNIQRREAELLADLKALDDGYREAVNGLTEREVIYSHPVYQYFQARYGLVGTSLHWEPDTMPGEEQWAALSARSSDTSIFVWEAKPRDDIAQRLEQMGIAQVTIDPGANTEQNWLELQKANIQQLRDIPRH